jgi:hypothetical protein
MNTANILKLAAIVLLPLCVFWNLVQVTRAQSDPPVASANGNAFAIEWPATWRGQTLRPLALSAVEQRFAQGFPGRIARLTDDHNVLIWRLLTRPTRMLHPATDCYRALGWRISDEHLEQQASGDLDEERWRCFIAEREGVRLRVCERIVDAKGISFTDASAWYWAAMTGQSTGPWQAVTVANPVSG